MGVFYGSIIIRTENSDMVQKALDEVAKVADCKFLLGPPVNGWISVFPDNGGQGDQASVETAKRLPYDIFHLVVHDDDIFIYYFFRSGRLIDQYNSCPDYFEKVSDEEKRKCQGHGEQLFVASNGMRVFDWNKLLSANGDAPAPELSVDAPKDDEDDPNSRPLAYCVRFDPERNLLLSSCLAGVIQFLNIKNGKAGTLLRPPDVVTIWRLELTGDRKALCCYCADQPPKNYYKGHRLQIWKVQD